MATHSPSEVLENAISLFLELECKGTSQIKPVEFIRDIRKGMNLVVVLEGEGRCATILEKIDIIENSGSHTLVLTADRLLTAAYHDAEQERVYMGTFPPGFKVEYNMPLSAIDERKVFVYEDR